MQLGPLVKLKTICPEGYSATKATNALLLLDLKRREKKYIYINNVNFGS